MSGPAPDPYATGVTDAQNTVTLVGAVVNLIAQPVTSIWQKRSLVQSLKERLGEWADEAQDEQGRWKEPVLAKLAFEDHLAREGGQFQPSGDCKSSFAWAQLLYALNIRPGNGIISWRLPSRDNDPVKTGVISLAIEGEALCHIINLYKVYKTRGRNDTIYRFPFGTLELQDDDVHSFKFTNGTLEEVASLKQPFLYTLQEINGPREGHLFDDGTAIAAYFNALHHGVSDLAAKLEKVNNSPQQTDPDREKSLQGRVKSLLRGMALLNQRNWKKSYLVNAAWIDDASRIKRRVTTNGGDDTFLVDHVHKCISERPEIVSRLKNSLRREEFWEDELKSTVEDLCMFQNDTFAFTWNMTRRYRSDKNERFKKILQLELPGVLEKLSELPDGSWGSDISKIFTVSELLQVLELEHEIVDAPVIVLPLVPTEWDFIGEIRG